MRHALAGTFVPVLLTSVLAAQASYSPRGEGCNGGPVTHCIAQNDQNPSLRIQSLPNEYAYAAVNATAATIQVVGFEVFTASVNGQPATVRSALYLDALGAQATQHSSPALQPVATGRLDVAGPAAWYTTALHPPIAIAPGAAFWLGAEAITVYPPDSTTGGPGIVASQWRRPPQGGTAWAATMHVSNPVFRVRCASGAFDVPVLAAAGTPRLGRSFGLQLTRGSPSLFGFLVYALDDSNWMSLPTPVDMALIGAPDCFLYTSSDMLQLVFLDPTGASTSTLAIPNAPQLSGMPFFNQWAALVPGANAASLLFSNYGAGIVGP